ncbi:hypothetical protein U1Q18_011520 [Sarracenia purpurea var. burkii]
MLGPAVLARVLSGLGAGSLGCYWFGRLGVGPREFLGEGFAFSICLLLLCTLLAAALLTLEPVFFFGLVQLAWLGGFAFRWGWCFVLGPLGPRNAVVACSVQWLSMDAAISCEPLAAASSKSSSLEARCVEDSLFM